jgi:hypothetical protein
MEVPMTRSSSGPLPLDTLADEVRRLRRQCRRLTAGMVLVLLGGVALTAMGQARPHVVEAQRFVVKDAHGKPRAILGTFGEAAAVNLYDREGRARAILQVGADGGSRLAFHDREAKSRTLTYVGPDGAAMVGFFGGDQKARAQLTVTADGNATVGLFDRDGNPAWPGKLFLP